MSRDKKQIQEIRRLLMDENAMGAEEKAKELAQIELDKSEYIKDIVRNFMQERIEAEDLREISMKEENRLIDEILTEARGGS